MSISFFFFNDTATTEIYTLSLHDALPILDIDQPHARADLRVPARQLPGLHLLTADDDEAQAFGLGPVVGREAGRSEEHTSELQSRQYLVCRLLLEKKKKTTFIQD